MWVGLEETMQATNWRIEDEANMPRIRCRFRQMLLMIVADGRRIDRCTEGFIDITR